MDRVNYPRDLDITQREFLNLEDSQRNDGEDLTFILQMRRLIVKKKKKISFRCQ